jgi:hypothetical protein
MQQKQEEITRKEVALTFRSMDGVFRAQDYSFLDFDYVYVGDKTLVVPAAEVERYQRLHPVVNEVIQAIELPPQERATHPREQLIFEASSIQRK